MRDLSILALVVGLLSLTGCQTTPSAPYGAPVGPGYVEQGPSGFSLFGPLVHDPKLAQGTGPAPLQYVYNLGVSGSQLSNTLLGGDPDESLSSRLGRAEANGNALVKHGIAPTIDFILGDDHCQQCALANHTHAREVWDWCGEDASGAQVARHAPHANYAPMMAAQPRGMTR